ncbi:MAG: pyridoxal phosphate-dependent aminotransferase family protein [Planctomycetes bacterium]|nr:pyridoxal phosphate-dependent aminotransferase family protein [Planctomycetota bacterium]
MQSPPGAETVIDGRRYLYFVGTGYLGLHGHPELIRAACRAVEQYGLGTATTRAGFGNAAPTLEVEQRAAEFFDAQAAFYFASGYVGNHLIVSSLIGEVDAVFADDGIHWSLVEASRLSGLPVHRFPHGDADGLRRRLKEVLRPGQRPLVMSDGVFSALGSIAPVPDYLDVLREYPGAALCLDDCHAVGVLGEHGRGTFEHFGHHESGVNTLGGGPAKATQAAHLFATGTLSKAFGAYGGILWGSSAYIERVHATSHYYDGASAPPIPAAAAGARALKLLSEEPHRMVRVRENAVALKRGLRHLGLETDDSPVPIICLTLGSSENMQRIQRRLMDEDILIAYMKCYSGLPATGALRIAVFATHTNSMLEQLVDTLRRVL